MPTTPDGAPRDPTGLHPTDLPSGERRGFLGARSRGQRVVRALVALAVLAGVVFGGRWAWHTYTNHRDRAASVRTIDRACAHLVDPDAVLGMRGGGIVRVKAADHASFSGDKPPGSCEIERVGRKPGSAYQHFELHALWKPDDHAANVVSGTNDWDTPFYRHVDPEKPRDPTRRLRVPLQQPLGHGTVGTYTDDSAIMTTPCRGGPRRPGNERAVRVRAAASSTLFGHHEPPVSGSDRDTLASIARQATTRSLKKLGCEAAHLPGTSRHLPDSRTKLVTSSQARGTCAWYRRFAEEKGRGNLPDRAIGTRTDDTAPRQSCALGASPRLTARTYERHRKLFHESPRESQRNNLWGVLFDSFTEDEARHVSLAQMDDEQRHVTPGTAGFNGMAGVAWGSSTCDGKPAVHTMSLDYPYIMTVEKRLPSLFRAYVKDAAEHRGCSHVSLPTAQDFDDMR